MKAIGFFLALFLWTVPGFSWEVTATPHGLREASLAGVVKGFETEAPATFKLQCAPGSDGSMSLIYIVADPKKFPRFPFDDFEGPDAPLAGRDLTTVHLDSPTGRKSLHTKVGGWFDTGFVFSASQPFGGKGVVREVFEAIRAGAQSLTWEVSDPRNVAWKLSSVFTLGAVTPELKAYLEACLAPVPAKSK